MQGHRHIHNVVLRLLLLFECTNYLYHLYARSYICKYSPSTRDTEQHILYQQIDSQVFRATGLLYMLVSPATFHCFDFPDYLVYSVPDDEGTDALETSVYPSLSHLTPLLSPGYLSNAVAVKTLILFFVAFRPHSGSLSPNFS